MDLDVIQGSLKITWLLRWQVLLKLHVCQLLEVFSFLFFCLLHVYSVSSLVFLQQLLGDVKVLLCCRRLPYRHSKCGHLFIRSDHLLAIFTEQELLDPQEFRPHQQRILVAAKGFEITSEDWDDFFEERMVLFAFSVHNLFFKCLRKLHLHPLLGHGACLLHQHHCVNQNCFVKELVTANWLTFVHQACHLLDSWITAFSCVLMEHSCVKGVQRSNSVNWILTEMMLAD